MSADNLEGKLIRLVSSRMKVFKKRFFKAAVMDDNGTLFHLIEVGDPLGGPVEFLPNVGCRKCCLSVCPGDAGDALHRRRDIDTRR